MITPIWEKHIKFARRLIPRVIIKIGQFHTLYEFLKKLLKGTPKIYNIHKL